jgi:hypothetical protein
MVGYEESGLILPIFPKINYYERTCTLVHDWAMEAACSNITEVWKLSTMIKLGCGGFPQ